METKSELAKAIVAVMNDVAGIEKSLTVGTGNSSYKGVSDKDVKRIIGNAMVKHGLCILPLGIDSKVTIERWEEMDNYAKQMKTKQLVFDEVNTKYLLLHISGESQVIAGHGHGVDSQDKSAGKATTYALKNALLYTFMVPTGDIDDADKTHSNDHPIPKKSDPIKVNIPTPIANTSIPVQTPVADEKKIHDSIKKEIGDDTNFIVKQKDFKATPEGSSLQSSASISDMVKLNDIELVRSFYKFIKKK
jgi:hypothetical protein